jgi:hypothetical protein
VGWLSSLDDSYDNGVTPDQVLKQVRHAFDGDSKSWGENFIEWGRSWSGPLQEKDRQAGYQGVKVFLENERSLYPLRYQPEDCEWVYEVRLQDALNLLIRVGADKKETVVAHIEGRQSFSCFKDSAVVLATVLKPQAEPFSPEVLAEVEKGKGVKAFFIRGNSVERVVNSPDPLLKLGKVVRGANSKFLVEYQDPQGNFVDDFALEWVPGEVPEIVDIENVLLPNEVWSPILRPIRR